MNTQIYVNLPVKNLDGHIWELVHMLEMAPAQA